ncbi:hypothetical protein E7Z59_00010 [Robertkochia marina]|uniref:Uncharacterized protein n=1 Tax=Robertkochia marina TaxID=1227945 RepID=A0A4S3M193_9FLAO|nr:hypothetical protein [Robertkochia marina]THD68753.1 hypothetical protein E7Z59_00010 [Robertkochia marina]
MTTRRLALSLKRSARPFLYAQSCLSKVNLPTAGRLTTPSAWLKQHLAFHGNFIKRSLACQNLRTAFYT